MPNIYVTDETKANLEKAGSLDLRTQDGEINFLCRQRIKELESLRNDSPSVQPESNNPHRDCQEKNSGGQGNV